jgi:hypothetical protein
MSLPQCFIEILTLVFEVREFVFQATLPFLYRPGTLKETPLLGQFPMGGLFTIGRTASRWVAHRC